VLNIANMGFTLPEASFSLNPELEHMNSELETLERIIPALVAWACIDLKILSRTHLDYGQMATAPKEPIMLAPPRQFLNAPVFQPPVLQHPVVSPKA